MDSKETKVTGQKLVGDGRENRVGVGTGSRKTFETVVRFGFYSEWYGKLLDGFEQKHSLMF